MAVLRNECRGRDGCSATMPVEQRVRLRQPAGRAVVLHQGDAAGQPTEPAVLSAMRAPG